jgi:hypothetical protein
MIATRQSRSAPHAATAGPDRSVDQGAPDRFAEQLTMSRGKWALYREEPGFLATAARLVGELGPPVVDALRAHAIALVKPEAWLGDLYPRIEAFLAANGFEIVETFRCELTPLTSREIWRYQWNVGPVERIELSEVLLALGPSYGLVLRDAAPCAGLAASVRLARRKGPALPSQQSPGQLRFELGAPSRMVSFVHIPDEPADVIRDLSILLDRRSLLRLAARLLDPKRPALRFDPDRFDGVARIDDRLAPPARTGGDQRSSLSERIERTREALARCRDDRGRPRIPRDLWQDALALAAEVSALPTLGSKRVEPVAEMSA